MIIKSDLLKKTFFLLLLFTFSFQVMAQEHKSVKAVKAILHRQADAWNKGDIEAFMQDYWKSDQLQFIGSKGVTYGWENTLNNYKKGYPDKQAMGQLSFDIISVDRLSRKSMMMVGKFYLERDGLENLSGHFLLVWKKVKGQWVIVADHTS